MRSGRDQDLVRTRSRCGQGTSYGLILDGKETETWRKENGRNEYAGRPRRTCHVCSTQYPVVGRRSWAGSTEHCALCTSHCVLCTEYCVPSPCAAFRAWHFLHCEPPPLSCFFRASSFLYSYLYTTINSSLYILCARGVRKDKKSSRIRRRCVVTPCSASTYKFFFGPLLSPKNGRKTRGVQIRKRRRLPNKVGAGQWAEALRQGVQTANAPNDVRVGGPMIGPPAFSWYLFHTPGHCRRSARTLP